MKVQTRMGRGRRIWVCPICGWRATISLGKHFQTGPSPERPAGRGDRILPGERIDLAGSPQLNQPAPKAKVDGASSET